MKRLLLGLAAVSIVSGVGLPAGTAWAGYKMEIDDTKWISLGIGGRVSFKATEDSAPSGSDWSNDFNLDNARIYIAGQIHEYVKFELNTECVFCGNSDRESNPEEFVVLDAIAKFEFREYFNIWGGRLLVPAERREMNGPFYASTYDSFKTPFYPSDFSVDFGTGGAGVYARDHGVNIWGAAGPDGALQYVFGVFNGLQSSSTFGPNQDDNPLFAGRVAYNFLEVEKNPGYYTSGTYFGGGGDIATVGFAFQYQEDGSGSFANPGDFFGLSVDVLVEKTFSDVGVFTFNGEYKYFDSDNKAAFAAADVDNFGMFDGNSFSVAALFLLPHEVGIGKFQPYVRYTGIYANRSSDRDEFEAGINYVIDGFNARVSLFYQYGDLATKGLNYARNVTGRNVSRIGLGIQLQF